MFEILDNFIDHKKKLVRVLSKDVAHDTHPHCISLGTPKTIAYC